MCKKRKKKKKRAVKTKLFNKAASRLIIQQFIRIFSQRHEQEFSSTVYNRVRILYIMVRV